jgi:hypothetical protein
MKYIEFKPVLLINDEFVIDESKLSDTSKQNILHVLKYYNVNYSLNNSHIMIEKSLWNDKDLMWNYTNKSNDKEWLISHPIE